MADYIESLVGDEGKILIEVSGNRGGVGFGAQKDKEGGEPDQLENAFNHALSTIQLAAGSVLETLNTLKERPSSARLDFAIKIDPEAGAMIATGDSKSQLRVSLTWNTTPDDDGDDD